MCNYEADYDKAKHESSYMNAEKFSTAINHFKTAFSLSDDMFFKLDCQQAIDECHELMVDSKNQEALDLYDTAVAHFSVSNYETSKKLLIKAYHTAYDQQIKSDCIDMLMDCEKQLSL